MAEAETDYDVLICGLGPVGQLLALLLGRVGVSVLAVDAASEPYDLPRAAVVDDEVLRILQAAGVVDEVLAASQVQEDVSFVPMHGRPLAILRPVDGIQGHPPLVSINQPTMEQTLIRALAGQPNVEARWSCRLKRFEQHRRGRSPHVEADLRPADGAAEKVRARWLVGCDGGSSVVRQMLGIEFGGSTFKQRWLVVDALVDRPLAKVPHPHFIGDWQRPTVSLPMSPGRHRWEWMLHPGEDPEPFLEPDSVRERVDGWLEDGERAEVERAVVYTFHARTASRWREGRVLLAGDAAHLMPPFAGQGFSSGARDAANLAWKLAAVTDGAPEALLDSYEAERRPHVEAMTRLAVSIGSFVQTANRRIAVLRDLFLTLFDRSGAAAWTRERIKPVPAYRDGAFAERPHRLPFKRSVGSQFPQSRVAAGGAELPLDNLAGPGWSAIALEPGAAGILAAAGVRAFVPGRDFEDLDGLSGEWLYRFGADWVILRPDRFVFAQGSGEPELSAALDELHRRLGRGHPAVATGHDAPAATPPAAVAA